MTTVLTIFLLMVFGFAFMAIEMLIVPGFSIPGIAGIALIGYAVFKAYVAYGLVGAFLLLAVNIILSIFVIKSALRTKAMRSISLEYTQQGNSAVDNYQGILGTAGKSITDLRPTGTAEINGSRYDVVTDGEYIDEQNDIIVKAVEGSRIIVSIQERK